MLTLLVTTWYDTVYAWISLLWENFLQYWDVLQGVFSNLFYFTFG